MASSEAAICNLALLRIGVTATIDALTDDTSEARACNLLYAHNRERLLCEAPWRFATRRAELSALADVTRNGWEYAYSLPEDCLLAREVWSGLRTAPLLGRVPFVVEGDASTGRILLCDLESTEDEPVELLYTALVQPTVWYPAHFVEILAWSMAADLAMALSVKESLAARARQMYEASLSRAIALEMNHADPDPQLDSELITVRG